MSDQLKKGKGQLFLFFLFACVSALFSRAEAVGLSRSDYLQFIEYYAQRRLWSQAHHLSAEMITRERPSFDDLKTHAYLIWESTASEPNRRMQVMKMLKNYFPDRGDPGPWLSLWREYMNRFIYKESLERIGVARVEIKRLQCGEVFSTLDRVIGEDRLTAAFAEVHLTALKKCKSKDSYRKAALERISEDPFADVSRSVYLDLLDEITEEEKNALVVQLEKEWSERSAFEVIEEYGLSGQRPLSR